MSIIRECLFAVLLAFLPLAVSASESTSDGVSKFSLSSRSRGRRSRSRTKSRLAASGYGGYRMEVDREGRVARFDGHRKSGATTVEPPQITGGNEWTTGACGVTPEQLVEGLQNLIEETATTPEGFEKSKFSFWESTSASSVVSFYSTAAIRYLSTNADIGTDVVFDEFLSLYPAFDVPFYEDPHGNGVIPVNKFFTTKSIGVPVSAMIKQLCNHSRADQQSNAAPVRVYFDRERGLVELQYALASRKRVSKVRATINELRPDCRLPFGGRRAAWHCLSQLEEQGRGGVSLKSVESRKMLAGIISRIENMKNEAGIEELTDLIASSKRVLQELDQARPLNVGSTSYGANALLDSASGTINYQLGSAPEPPAERVRVEKDMWTRFVKGYKELYDRKELDADFFNALSTNIRETEAKEGDEKIKEWKQINERMIALATVIEREADMMWDLEKPASAVVRRLQEYLTLSRHRKTRRPESDMMS